MLYILLAGNSGDLREGEFQKNLFLVINNIDTRPVDSDYHIVLGQVGAYQSDMSLPSHDPSN